LEKPVPFCGFVDCGSVDNVDNPVDNRFKASFFVYNLGTAFNI